MVPEKEEKIIYISLQDATKFCNYSQEYLSLRARQGKLKSVKLGRNWLTTKEWLEEYLARNGNGNGHPVTILAAEKPIVMNVVEPPENLPVGTDECLDIRFPGKYPEIGYPFAGRKLIRSVFVLFLTVALIFVGGVFGKESLKSVVQDFGNLTSPVKNLAMDYLEEAGFNFFEGAKIAENFFDENYTEISNSFNRAIARADKIISEGVEKSESQKVSVGGVAITIGDIADEAHKVVTDYGRWLGYKIRNSPIGENYVKADNFLKKNIVKDFKDLSLKYISADSWLEQKFLITGRAIAENYSSANNYLENKNEFLEQKFVSFGLASFAQNLQKSAGVLKNIASEFTRDSYRFVTSPIKKLMPTKEISIGKEEFEQLKSDLAELKQSPFVIKRIEVEKVVEPIKEITRDIETVKQITKIDDKALADVRATLAYLEGEIGKRLYAPGGVISQTIRVTEPVQSPKIYQENGEIVLQTRGSGNVILSAATGLQMYGSQVVIESTNTLNPMIYLASKSRVGGDLAVTGETNISSKLSVGGAATVSGNLSVGGDLTVSGSQSFSGPLTISASSAPAVLTITQTGTGDLLNLKDGSTEVFTVLDGGNVGISTTTPSSVFAVGGDIMGSGNVTFYSSTATTTISGNLTVGSKVGIGTTTLSTNLLTVGTTTPAFFITNNGSVGFNNITYSWPSSQGGINTLLKNDGSGNLTWGSSSGGSNWQFVAGNNAITPTTTVGIIVSASSTFAGDLTIASGAYNSATLFASSSLGRIGIGTTTLAGLFTVGTSTPAFVVSPEGKIGIGTTTFSGLLSVGTSTPSLIVDQAGRVGISTTTPSDIFAVQGNILGSGNIVIYGTATSTFGGPITATGDLRTTGSIYPTTDVLYNLGAPALRWANIYAATTTIGGTITIDTDDIRATGLLTISSGGASNIILDSAKNVGIGTTTPLSKLSISGDLVFGLTASTRYATGTTISSATSTFAGGFISLASSTISNYFSVGTSTTPDLFVDTGNGRVGIGTTGPGTSLEISGAHVTNKGLLYLNSTGASFIGLNSGDTTNNAGTIFRNNGTNKWLIYNAGASSDRLQFDSGSVTGAMVIQQEGNVGIGTTTPLSRLSVSGDIVLGLAASTRYATGTTISSATSTFAGGFISLASSTIANYLSVGTSTIPTLLVDSGSGMVGVATTSPAFAFSVHGQCVTGDTRLRRRRRKIKNQKSKIKNIVSDYIYDEVQIKDVQPGDEIASLDENTGKIVYRKVNALLDMGVKQIFKLIAESGRTIRTTINHPYLTKNGWTKVGNIKVGDEIAVPTKNPAFLQDLEDSTLQGNQFATGTSIIANQITLSSGVDNQKAVDLGEVASQESQWQTGVSLLSRPTANLVYQNFGNNQSDIFWDKIISIEHTGEEQVYDIEVEGTHNFIGNDIFAHNTYISATTTINSDLIVKGATKNVATKIVAASDSENFNARADYVATSSDAQTVINQAINALPSKGGIVYLLEGNYTITNPINIVTSSVALIGAGKSTILRRNWNNAAANGVITVGDGGTTAVSGVLIQNLAIDGVDVSYTAATNYGIYLKYKITNSKILNNWLYDNSGRGAINLDDAGSAGNANSAILIKGNDIRNGANSAIQLCDNCSYIVIEGNTLMSNGADGVEGEADYSVVNGNIIQGNSGEGINMSGSTGGNVISENMIYLNSSNGIVIGGNNIVSSNVLINNGGTGSVDSISVASARDNTIIVNNFISDSSGSGQGIDIGASTNDNIYLAGNYIIGAGFSSNINDAGTGTIYGNQLIGNDFILLGPGNFGISTTTPRHPYKLDVWGDFAVGTSTASNAASASTTPAFYVDSGNGGRIGIGTTTLAGLFTVGTSTPAFVVSPEGKIGIGTTTFSGLLSVGTSTPSLIVDQAGRVGISTTTPSDIFAVQGNILGSGNMVIYGTATSTFGGPIVSTGDLRTTGSIYPTTDVLYYLGAPALRWANIYTATTTIGGTIVIDTDDIRASGLLTVSSTDMGILVSGANGNIGVTSTNAIYLATNNTERMRILQNGNVGIGTSTPLSRLSVSGDLVFGLTASTRYATGTTISSATSTFAGGFISLASSTISNYFSVGTSTTPDLFVDTGNGRVGIGTKAPLKKLHVGAGADTSGITADGIIVQNAGDTAITVRDATNDIEAEIWSGLINSAGVVRIGSYTNHPATFVANNIEYMRIIDTGNVGIGSVSPGEKLTVASGNIAAGDGTATTTIRYGATGAATSSFAGDLSIKGIFMVGDGSATSTLRGASVATSTINSGLTAGNNAAFVVNQAATANSLYIDPSGKIGIGTTTAFAALTIAESRDIAIGTFNENVLDDMEGSVINWKSSDTTNVVTSTEQSVVRVGGQSLKIAASGASEDDTVRKTFSSNQDLTNYERLGFWIYADRISTSTATTTQLISFAYHDTGGTESTSTISIQQENRWQYQEITLTSTAADKNAIDYMQFRIDFNNLGAINFYIDQVRAYDDTERTAEMFVGRDGALVVMGRGGVEIGRADGSSNKPGLKVDTVVVEINQPLAVNVGGDVGMDNDLQFLSTGLSQITSEGPLRIAGGDPNHNENLTLTVGGGGDVIVETTNSSTSFMITQNWAASTSIAFIINAETNSTTSADSLLQVISDVNSDENVVFDVDAGGNVRYDGTASSPASDVAENYKVIDESIESGEVVCLSNERNTIEKCSRPYQGKLLGVISGRPALLMGGDLESSRPVALAGRVPVKISLENGPIAIGDALTSASSTPGYAMKATRAGKIFGYALEVYAEVEPPAGFGEVEPPAGGSTSTDSSPAGDSVSTILAFIHLDELGGDLTVSQNELGNLVVSTYTATGQKTLFSLDETGALVVGKIKTQELCVGSVCVTEADFMRVFGASAAEVEPPVGGSTSTDSVSTTTATSTEPVIVPDLPDSVIDSGPELITTSTEPSFTFHSTKAGSTFSCQIDSDMWAGCDSPKTYTALMVGLHQFQVQAIDISGLTEPTPSIYSWEVIAETIITSTSTESMATSTTP